MKKTLHIIPHSHWDREWYMPFEKHRVRLIDLFDDLIKVMEENEEAENKVKEFQASVKETRKKEQEKRKTGREKARQEKIDIHSEAFLKAFKEWKAAGEACDLAN